MKKEIRNKPASIRARLMNIAKAEDIDFDAVLLRYFQERFLSRLAISEFSEQLVLKGGLLLICLNMPKLRPTKDIDFLAVGVKNDSTEMEGIVRKIAGISCDDSVRFNLSSITSERIKEGADYEGIRLKIDATIGKAMKKLQIDIGFGDIIIPEAKTIEFPTLLDSEPSKLKVYSIESIISEKFEAMVKLAVVNSRMKDFYDIYSLSLNYNFQGNKVKNAIESTFRKRKTHLPNNPLVFRTEFQEDREKQRQWIAFLRKSRLSDVNQKFSKIMGRIITFLRPIIISIQNKTRLALFWNSANGSWDKKTIKK